LAAAAGHFVRYKAPSFVYTPDTQLGCAKGALETHLQRYCLRGHALSLEAAGERGQGKRPAALLKRKPKQARQQRMPGSLWQKEESGNCASARSGSRARRLAIPRRELILDLCP
jgi:hypothetical protein